MLMLIASLMYCFRFSLLFPDIWISPRFQSIYLLPSHHDLPCSTAVIAIRTCCWTNLPITTAINHSNGELNPICHLLALLGAHRIFHVGGLSVNTAIGLWAPNYAGSSLGRPKMWRTEPRPTGPQLVTPHSWWSLIWPRHFLRLIGSKRSLTPTVVSCVLVFSLYRTESSLVSVMKIAWCRLVFMYSPCALIRF